MNQRQLHEAVLQEAAIYFGWESFKHYNQRRGRQAKKLVHKVYIMSIVEKQKMLNALRNKPAHDAYERENGKII